MWVDPSIAVRCIISTFVFGDIVLTYLVKPFHTEPSAPIITHRKVGLNGKYAYNSS